MKKRYAYRAYPTPGQQKSAARLFGCCRVVFNDFIAARELAHSNNLPFESATTLQARLLTQAKRTPERAWLARVSSVALQQAVRDAERAYRNFFDSLSGKRKGPKVGRPRFKKRRGRQSARFTAAAAFTVRQTTHGVGKVFLPKIGWVRFVLSRPLPADPSSVTIMLNADGTYEVSFVVEVSVTATVVENPGRVAGIDLGLIDFASVVYSDGTREKITNPRHLKKAQKRLTRAQRALARKVGPDKRTRHQPSNNWRKQSRRVARVHADVAHVRTDFQRKLVSRLNHENQVVVVEQLKVKNMSKSARGTVSQPGKRVRQKAGLNRSILDAAWGQFLRILVEVLGEGRGVLVNPAGTSQQCSGCGWTPPKGTPRKGLSVREWDCPGCGARLDRDYNAALNIMVAAGLAETLNACGGGARPRPAEPPGTAVETGTHRNEMGLAA